MVAVPIDDEALLRGHRQECEHMATGKRGHESVLWINQRRVAAVGRSSRSGKPGAPFKDHGVIAVVRIVCELLGFSLPFQRNPVFRHGVPPKAVAYVDDSSLNWCCR